MCVVCKRTNHDDVSEPPTEEGEAEEALEDAERDRGARLGEQEHGDAHAARDEAEHELERADAAVEEVETIGTKAAEEEGEQEGLDAGLALVGARLRAVVARAGVLLVAEAGASHICRKKKESVSKEITNADEEQADPYYRRRRGRSPCP